MTTFFLERLKKHTHFDDVINLKYKTSNLPSNLNVDDIDFTNSRGSVRISSLNVLTPRDEEIMLNEILAFDFGK